MDKNTYKVKVPVASDSRTHVDKSCNCIMTTDFFIPRVTYFDEMMGGEKRNINMSSVTRALALLKPSFADVKVIHRCFKIPFRTIFKNWNAFIDANNVYSSTPVLDAWRINKFFYDDAVEELNHKFGELVTTDMPDMYDIAVTGAFSNSTHKINDDQFFRIRFNKRGRMVWNILRSLGYVYNTVLHGFSQNTPLNKPSSIENKVFSALPLLAYLKVLRDYVLNSRYRSTIQMIDNIIDGVGSSMYFTDNQLAQALNVLGTTYYMNDYFTSMWESPDVAFNSYSTPTLDMIPSKEADITDVNDLGHYPGVNIAGNNTKYLTASVLQSLMKLSDYTRRNTLAGVREVDVYLARYGVKLSNDKLNRSQYYGCLKDDLLISNVTSTADSGSMDVGDVAGMAWSTGKVGNFSIDSEGEFCYCMIISTIVPRISYFQGSPRFAMHRNREDFFVPEFDGLGTRPVRFDELFSELNRPDAYNDAIDRGYNLASPSTSIGFTDRYAEYKTNTRDSLVLGDFYSPFNVGLDCWHLNRIIDPLEYSHQFGSSVLPENFRRADIDGNQYDRIFADVDQWADGFQSVIQFNVDATIPARAMYDNYEWYNHDDSRNVDLSSGGSSM